jgi:Uma2 family endonuclease
MTELAIPIPLSGKPVAATWPAQGQWTYEDYLQLPDDGRRYEIIAGVLYVTNAPGFEHQYAVHQIAVALELWARAHPSGIVLTAPFEVHLPGIAKPVQPDVLFIAAARRPEAKARFFAGAPDVVIEVLSPASMRLDRSISVNLSRF